MDPGTNVGAEDTSDKSLGSWIRAGDPWEVVHAASLRGQYGAGGDPPRIAYSRQAGVQPFDFEGGHACLRKCEERMIHLFMPIRPTPSGASRLRPSI